jgi:quinol monooxygenase YgiN
MSNSVDGRMNAECFVQCRYKDAEAAEAHKNSPHFAQAIKEGMAGKLAAPPNIQTVKRQGGFRRG